MTNHPNETPEPRAKEQAGEMKTVAYLVTGLRDDIPSLCFEDERGDYGDEDHMPVFDELCRRSEFTAALQAKDAEIAGLKADAGRWSFVRHHWSNVQMHWNKDATNSLKSIVLTIKTAHWTSGAEAIEKQIDATMKGEAA